jgi:hypothetical protein
MSSRAIHYKITPRSTQSRKVHHASSLIQIHPHRVRPLIIRDITQLTWKRFQNRFGAPSPAIIHSLLHNDEDKSKVKGSWSNFGRLIDPNLNLKVFGIHLFSNGMGYAAIALKQAVSAIEDNEPTGLEEKEELPLHVFSETVVKHWHEKTRFTETEIAEICYEFLSDKNIPSAASLYTCFRFIEMYRRENVTVRDFNAFFQEHPKYFILCKFIKEYLLLQSHVPEIPLKEMFNFKQRIHDPPILKDVIKTSWQRFELYLPIHPSENGKILNLLLPFQIGDGYTTWLTLSGLIDRLIQYNPQLKLITFAQALIDSKEKHLEAIGNCLMDKCCESSIVTFVPEPDLTSSHVEDEVIIYDELPPSSDRLPSSSGPIRASPAFLIEDPIPVPVKDDVQISSPFPNARPQHLCAICFEESIQTVFETCSHASCCLDCTGKLLSASVESKKCPICKGVITDFRRIYLS